MAAIPKSVKHAEFSPVFCANYYGQVQAFVWMMSNSTENGTLISMISANINFHIVKLHSTFWLNTEILI